jgi:glycolate oxidase iron-sulfur subunit
MPLPTPKSNVAPQPPLPPAGPPCSEMPTTSQSMERLLEACIHCGMCLNTCPTYLVTGSEAESPRGRLYLMKKWEEGALASANQLSTHLDNCLGCLNCQTACPSGVQYGHLLNHYKETLSPLQIRTPKQGLTRWVKRAAFRWLLPHRFMLELMGWSLRFYKASGLQTLVRATGLLNPLGLAHLESLTPTMPTATPMLHSGQRFGPPDAPLVGLHIGCMMDTVFRPVHWATIAVLVANGYQVLIPPQACCGALAHHAGETDIARSLARENLDRLLATPIEAILFNSAGCGAEMKDYTHLFEPDDPYHAKAVALAAKTQDITQWLARQPLAPMPNTVAQTVTYHGACHLHHAQQVHTQPIELLKQVPGLTLIPLAQAELCCGSGGIFNLEHPEISEPVLALKMERIEATGAACIATGNPGCTLQLQHGITVIGGAQTVVHPIEILAQAYGPQTGVFPAANALSSSK